MILFAQFLQTLKSERKPSNGNDVENRNPHALLAKISSSGIWPYLEKLHIHAREIQQIHSF